MGKIPELSEAEKKKKAENRHNFAAKMGEIIHSWARVEMALCRIFGFGSDTQYPMRFRLFHAPEAFRDKLELTHQALLAKLPASKNVDKMLEAWNGPKGGKDNKFQGLRKRTNDWAGFRNRVAHGCILSMNSTVPPYGDGLEFHLRQPVGSAKWDREFELDAVDPISLDMLEKSDEGIISLYDDLQAYVSALKDDNPELLPSKGAKIKPPARGK